jgi:hypothetical protein
MMLSNIFLIKTLNHTLMFVASHPSDLRIVLIILGNAARRTPKLIDPQARCLGPKQAAPDSIAAADAP